MNTKPDTRHPLLAALLACVLILPAAGALHAQSANEIYDAGNDAVERDFYESINWYQKAREGGEQSPPPKPRLPGTP